MCYIRLERKNGSSFSKILKAIYFNAPVLRHSLDWLHFGFGTLAIGREALARSIKSKMAVSFRGFDIGVYPVRHPGCYDLLWKEVDKIHVISDDIKTLVYEEGFNEQCPVVKITPAIDISYFTDSNFKPISDPVKMVTIARLHWKKGLDYTLKALALLNEKGVDFEYTIIGAGPEFEKLKFTTYQLGLQDKVMFKGELKHDEIKSILADSMLYLQYSVQEGFCNSVLEAQAMGLLCIVSNAEGLSENVLHEQTGWVVDKRNSELLAERIEAVLHIPLHVQKSISYNAKERVRKEFNVEDQIAAFIKFYE